MKATSTLLAGVIILAMGLILIICHNTITGSGIVTAGGIIFVISALVDIVLYIGGRNREGQRRKRGAALVFGWIVSVAALLLGISMFVFNDTFTQLIAPMFGILVLLGALVQLWILTYGTRPVRMPLWLYTTRPYGHMRHPDICRRIHRFDSQHPDRQRTHHIRPRRFCRERTPGACATPHDARPSPT